MVKKFNKLSIWNNPRIQENEVIEEDNKNGNDNDNLNDNLNDNVNDSLNGNRNGSVNIRMKRSFRRARQVILISLNGSLQDMMIEMI